MLQLSGPCVSSLILATNPLTKENALLFEEPHLTFAQPHQFAGSANLRKSHVMESFEVLKHAILFGSCLQGWLHQNRWQFRYNPF